MAEEEEQYKVPYARTISKKRSFVKKIVDEVAMLIFVNNISVSLGESKTWQSTPLKSND